MILYMMIAQTQTEMTPERGMTTQEKPAFLRYLEEKAQKKIGRPHLVRKIGIEKTLMALRDIYVKGLKPPTVAKNYGIDYKSLWRFLKELEQNGYTDEIRDYFSRAEDISRYYDNHPIIKKWKERIIVSGSLSQLRHIQVMKKILTGQICPQFKCSPDEFDINKAQEFLLKCYENNIDVKHHYIMAIRHFLQIGKDIVIPRGLGGAYGLSGAKQSYGKYSHVRMSEEQIEKVKEYLRTHYRDEGYDLLFEFGIITCARAQAILTAPLNTIDLNFNTKIAITKVFESKVGKGDSYLWFKRGKWWVKYLPKDLAKRLIDFAKRKGHTKFIFVPDDIKPYQIKYEEIKKISKALREAYKYAGVIEPYFYKKPLHSLRHVGAIRWLEATNWNYALVAKIGGWLSVQTLMDCYGGIPQEVVINAVHKMFRSE